MTFVLCDSSQKNEHGFTLDLSGVSLDRFRANPVMLFDHKHSQVIGRWMNIRVEENRLLADAEFDTEDDLGKNISRKVEKGYLKGCSLGLRILRVSETDSGVVVTKSDILEASIVAVPSDRGAILLYDENDTPTTLEAVKLSFNLNQKIQNMEQKIELTAPALASLGVQADASPQAVELAIAEKDRRITELEAKVKAFEKTRIEEMVNLAVAEKKIGADEKDTYVALAGKDFEGVSRILSKMQGVNPIAKQLSVVSPGAVTGSWDDLDRAGKLVALKAENPEEFKRLFKEKFGTEPNM